MKTIQEKEISANGKLLRHSPILRAFRLFFSAPATHPLAVLVCVVLAGILEAVSFGALVPAVALVGGSNNGPATPMISITRKLLAPFGLEASLGALIFLITGAMLCKAVLTFLALGYAANARAKMLTTLRQRLIGSLLSAKWSYFAGQRIGQFTSAVSADIVYAGNAYLYSARYIAGLFQTLALISVAFLVSWKVTGLGIAVAAVLMIALRFFMIRSYRSGIKNIERTSDLVALLVDTLHNLKALKTMNRKQPIAALLTSKSRSAQKAIVAQELAKLGLQNSQDALSATLFGGGLYFAAIALKVPLAELVGIGVLVFRIVASVTKSQNFLQVTAESEGAYWRTLALIARTDAESESEGGALAPTFEHGCSFESVTFSHGSKPILKNVNIEIRKGSITVLQGASGAGKTTIIDLLSGLYRPTGGRILVDGVDLNHLALGAWRSMLGYVPQELTLLHTSITENITLGDASITEQQIWHAIEVAGATDFVKSLPEGLDTDVGQMGIKLSGGQRQRIALARAIVGRPKLLILDEVTSALDPATERDICSRIGELAGDFTIVAITHRQAWTSIATNLYKVAGGRVTRESSTRKRRPKVVANVEAVELGQKES